MAYQILSFSTSPFTQNRIYSLLCDTAADLPASVDGYSVGQGWTAKIIEDGSSYIANSSGSWILQPNDYVTGNYYTKSETDGLLSAHVCTCTSGSNTYAKVATTTDDFVLREGAIIAVKFSNPNYAVDNSSHPITLNVNDTGDYRIYYSNGDYTNASSQQIFGATNRHIYYMFSNDRWVWLAYSQIYAYSTMTQAQATAGTGTTGYLMPPKVLHDTILEQTNPLKYSLIPVINDNTGKNTVKPTATTQEVDGILWTVNSDGTITADGTATANSYITVQVLPADSVFDGSYYLSGCPAGGSASTHALYVARSSYTKYDYGSGVELTESTDGLNKNLIAIVYNGQTVDNIVFKPMICKKAYWDISPDFEPYCPTLAELYQLVKSYHP